MNNKIAMMAVTALLVGGVVVVMTKNNGNNGAAQSQMSGHVTPKAAKRSPEMVALPTFNLTEKRGEAAFNANCAACHGKNLTGTEQGPPFLHPVYKAGHHADGAFYLAAKNGVRAHHWPFGNMPAQPQIKDGEMKAVVAYVRAVQQANGF